MKLRRNGAGVLDAFDALAPRGNRPDGPPCSARSIVQRKPESDSIMADAENTDKSERRLSATG
jgi:hypothetical protein